MAPDTADNETGRFKIEVRHEGYHSSQFTPGTQINRGYLIGKGPLSTRAVADRIAYNIVQQVMHGESISDVLLAEYSDPLFDTQDIPDSCTATTVNKDTFKEYDADAEFDLYFWRYEEAQISRNHCSPGEPIRRPSREQFLEMADRVEDEFARKQAGNRRRDYRFRTMYRPPLDQRDFVPVTDGEDILTDLFNTKWAERVLSFTTTVERNPDVWDVNVVVPSNRDIGDNWAHRTPAISWTYTGEIADYYGSRDRPGFTVSGIPPREEFLIETADFRLTDGEKDSLPVDWAGAGGSGGSPRPGVNGQPYTTRNRLNVFITSQEATEDVLQWFLDVFPEKLETKVFQQVLSMADDVGKERKATVIDAYDSVWALFEADVDSLQAIDGIGAQTAQAIQDAIEERKTIAKQ